MMSALFLSLKINKTGHHLLYDGQFVCFYYDRCTVSVTCPNMWIGGNLGIVDDIGLINVKIANPTKIIFAAFLTNFICSPP